MEVLLFPTAKKQYDKLSKFDREKIKKKLQFIAQFPLDGKKLSGEFAETRSVRAWPYRIIYQIDSKGKRILVVTIGHRQGVYK